MGARVYHYLEESIETLDHQVCFMRDEAWLKHQAAADLALLHGVLFDNTARLFAAFRPADEGEPVGYLYFSAMVGQALYPQGRWPLHILPLAHARPAKARSTDLGLAVETGEERWFHTLVDCLLPLDWMQP